MNIYLVDDSDLLRERLIGIIAETPGIKIVGQADNVDSAISDIKNLKPDLIFLDIRLPDGSGIDLLRAIKKTKGLPKIIMLTNYPYTQYEKKCKEYGADHFLDKSSDFDRIPDLLKHGIK